MILNANSILRHVIQTKNGIMKHSNVRVTIIVSAKKIIVEILANVFVRNANTQVITYDEIISVMDNVLTKMTSTTATNVTENYHSKKVRFYC